MVEVKVGSSNHLRIEHVIKHNPIVQKLYKCVMSEIFKLWGQFIKTDKNIVLMNGHGYRYNDSPRAIYEKMLEMGIADKFHIVWALNDPNAFDIPGNVTKVKMDTLSYFKVALQA